MRIAVFGACGRIGTHLIEAILARPDLQVGAAHVSPTSASIGRPVAGSLVEYRPAEAAINANCDVIIDFSTPEASLQLQRVAGARTIPIVVGTTGFSAAQRAELEQAALLRPLLIGANFALGFTAFAASTHRFALLHPGARVTVDETYHQRKKRVPSGTSLQLAADIRTAQSTSGAGIAPEPAIRIHRVGNTVGINEVMFDLGVSQARFTFTVGTLAAYAEGALEAAIWLAAQRGDPRLYAPEDVGS